MSRSIALLVACAAAVAAVGGVVVLTTGSEAQGAVKARQIYLSAVEWKGSGVHLSLLPVLDEPSVPPAGSG